MCHVRHIDPNTVLNDRVVTLEPGVGGGWQSVIGRTLKEGNAPLRNGQVLRALCKTPKSCRWCVVCICMDIIITQALDLKCQ